MVGHHTHHLTLLQVGRVPPPTESLVEPLRDYHCRLVVPVRAQTQASLDRSHVQERQWDHLHRVLRQSDIQNPGYPA